MTASDPSPEPSADAPFVSVLMPVRNEARYIERSLGAVLAQDYPRDKLEVLVADGRSTDTTRDVIARLAADDGRVRLIDNPRGIVATGLNAATAEARGTVLVRVDGHCEIASDYVRRAVAHLAGDELSGFGVVSGVGGPIETVGESAVARVIAVAMSSRFGVGGSAFRTGTREPRLVDTIAFPAYPRRVVDEVGRYDEELVRNQDDEYNYRLRKAGHRLLLAPDIRSRYYSRADPRSLWRQFLQYGYWKVRVMQKHPRQMRGRQMAPPAFVLSLIATAAWLPWLGWPPLAVLLGLHLLAGLGAALAAPRTPWWGRLALPPIFLTMHVAYGTGFLAGLVRFAGRWRRDSWGRDDVGA